MWSAPVDIPGLNIQVTVLQFTILVGFISLIIGYLLAMAFLRRPKIDPELEAAKGKERATSNVAFMKGINYILSEKHDQAIEELTRAVSVDTETVETYVALGNLFRRNGEIDRAIRIRQSIILRPNIDEKALLQAKYDLGLDYKRGGFYERALQTFEEVTTAAPGMIDAHRQLVQIYEETRDWDKAAQSAEKIGRITGERPLNVLAHYQVERGKDLFEQGLGAQAKNAYKKAISMHPGCVDAYLHMGDLLLHERKAKKALAVWRKLIDVAPDMTFLVFGRLARLMAVIRDLRPVEAFLRECASVGSNPLAHLTLARLLAEQGKADQAIEELNKALSLDDVFLEARKELGLLLISMGRTEEALEAYREMLNKISGREASFQCESCGFESNALRWRCPQCLNWDTVSLKKQLPRLLAPGPEPYPVKQPQTVEEPSGEKDQPPPDKEVSLPEDA